MDSIDNLEKRIQKVLTDMAFSKNRMAAFMEDATKNYHRRLEIELRKAFLARFRFPMKLARGTFVRWHYSEMNVFCYDGTPFLRENSCMCTEPAPYGAVRSTAIYSFEPVTSDFLPMPLVQPEWSPTGMTPQRRAILQSMFKD